MKALLLFSTSLLLVFSCKKNEVKTQGVEKDISTLTLPELKNTVAGNWKLVYTWQFFSGRQDFPNTYIDFYNFSDSIKWTENNVVTVRTNASYTKDKNYLSGDSTYIIYHVATAQNKIYNWSAEYLRNDTLIIKTQTSNPTSYFLIR